MRIFLAVLIGSFMGYVFPQFFFNGSAMNLIPWGIIGFLIGWFAISKKEGLLLGAVYGFSMSFAFMVHVYSGSAPLLTRVPFFALLGLVGALCGGILGCIGALGKGLMSKEKIPVVQKRG